MRRHWLLRRYNGDRGRRGVKVVGRTDAGDHASRVDGKHHEALRLFTCHLAVLLGSVTPSEDGPAPRARPPAPGPLYSLRTDLYYPGVVPAS